MMSRGRHPLRRQRAIEQIEKLIVRRKLHGRRLLPERQLAAELGIARGTLQKALLDLESRGIIQRIHGSGTFVAEEDQSRVRREWLGARICLLVPRVHLSSAPGWTYYGDMVRGAIRAGKRAKVSVETAFLETYWEDGPTSAWTDLKKFTGFIVVQTNEPRLMNDLLRLRRGPVIGLDSHFRDLPVTGVVDGSFNGARHAVGHLLRGGHRRIGYVAPGEYVDPPHEKTKGYEAALAEGRVSFDPGLCCRHGRSEAGLDAAIDKAVGKWLDLEDPVTAIFAATDSRALPAMKALERRGLRAGTDIALIGYGDAAFRTGICDRLTSVRINTRRMGEAAVGAMFDRSVQGESRTVIVPDRLVVRSTSCSVLEVLAGRKLDGGQR